MKNDPEMKIACTIFNRIKKILMIAQNHHHPALILGAWGCGVFKNDPMLIASCFSYFLTQNQAPMLDYIIQIADANREFESFFCHAFKRIIFAVGSNELDPNYIAFKKYFF